MISNQLNTDIDRVRIRTDVLEKSRIRNKTILDIGVGPLAIIAARDFNCKVTSIDISKEELDIAKEDALKEGVDNINFELEDATNLSYKNETFDSVISFCALHHIPINKRNNFIQELFRVAKEKIIVVDLDDESFNQIHSNDDYKRVDFNVLENELNLLCKYKTFNIEDKNIYICFKLEKIKKQFELTEIEKLVYNCRKCSELNIKLPNTSLMGQGNPEARLMFVAQNPCELCAIERKIFYKGSGEVLDKGLCRISENRLTVYITNVCKCHTPNNRKIRKLEIDNCKPFLEKEIEIIKPEIIVPLGKKAFNWFDCVDWYKMIERDDYKIYPMSHPAFIIRNSDLLDEYLEKWDVLKDSYPTAKNANYR